MKRKKLRKMKRRRMLKIKTLRLAMPLIEISKLLIKQELKLSKQLFPKNPVKKILVMMSLPALRKLQMKHLQMKRQESLLTTTKEEVPLQLPETP